MNATAVYKAMIRDINYHGYTRQVLGGASPMQEETFEAEPGRHYTMKLPQYNVPNNALVDMRWAKANVLHFFACTEEAAPLYGYNKNAKRFLTGNIWKGAYGLIALPQITLCMNILSKDINSRRAIVSMGDAAEPDINSPSCWTTLQFLYGKSGLDLLVYQRSLNLRIMPYDCILFSNILHFVCEMLKVQIGYIRWTVGSLHATKSLLPGKTAEQTLLVPMDILRSPMYCWEELEDGLRKDAD